MKYLGISFAVSKKVRIFARKACETRLRLSNWSKLHCIRLARALQRETYKQKENDMSTANLQSTPFTPFQIEMLELVARVNSEREMTDIRRMLGQYFAKRAEDAIDQLWDEGVLNDNVIEDWKNEHMRTPYKQ